MKKYLFIIIVILFGNCSNKNDNQDSHKFLNKLSDEEISNGWILLFDGNTLNGWHEFGKEKVGKGWLIKNGELIAFRDSGNSGSDIITDSSFVNFEFNCEWKISNGGNSGIFYHIVENEDFTSPIQTAPEYQLIDDIGFPERLEEWQKTGANYALHIPKENKILKKVGEWNESKIIVNDSLVEHYLNSKKILEFKRWTNEWKQLVKNSKWKDYPNYGLSNAGKIGLQSHGNSIWFRNIKIRKIN